MGSAVNLTHTEFPSHPLLLNRKISPTLDPARERNDFLPFALISLSLASLREWHNWSMIVCFLTHSAKAGLNQGFKPPTIWDQLLRLGESHPQSTYFPSPLSWSVHCNFTGDGKCNERGWACTPHPHQPGLILPSWLNVRQKAAVATLCTLWSHLRANLFNGVFSLKYPRLFNLPIPGPWPLSYKWK